MSRADKMLVFDSGSTAATIAICREYTDRVYCAEDWSGYGPLAPPVKRTSTFLRFNGENVRYAEGECVT